MDDEERNNVENIGESSITDEFMLPGFRFHPTDEELVGFYLRRKVEHKPLSIEIIKQIDIYKYDPWDLPRLATIGEKEWYFYCPRDRKYRNSVRPNRVTGGGFWKATGTDRPVYAEGSKCIGLKKSLVFYRGRAAKGTKTDWMMHEFRLPSVSDPFSAKKYLDKTSIPENEAWAICKIFKKANSGTRRSLSHSWISPAISVNNTFIRPPPSNSFDFISINATTTTTNTDFRNDITQPSSTNTSFSSMQSYPPPVKPYNHSLQNIPFQEPASTEQTSSEFAINDASSLLLDMSSSVLGGFIVEDFSNMSENVGGLGDFSVPLMSFGDVWNPNFLWDSSPCPSELSATYSTNQGLLE